MKALKVGIDNYGLDPLQLSPLEVLEWARDSGAEGVQFSGLNPEQKDKIDRSYLKDLAQFASSNNMYLEWGGGQHIPLDMETWKKKDILKINRAAAEFDDHTFERTFTCAGGAIAVLVGGDNTANATE